MQKKGYAVHFTEFNGNHTLLNWRGTLANHLIALVGIAPAPKISSSSSELVASSLVRRKAIPTAEVKVPSALLKNYVGRYQLDPQFIIYVSVENDSLWVNPSDLRARRMIAD